MEPARIAAGFCESIGGQKESFTPFEIFQPHPLDVCCQEVELAKVIVSMAME
jgi:hypothetical protein